MAADPITSNAVDKLLSHDISDDDDLFADNPSSKSRDDKTTLSPRSAKRKVDDDKENFGLGLDEEVKITKKKKPIAKLDEARLLSHPGIPKLRALARSGQITKKLHLKGKGHEFSDASKLLNYYQLWLDDLYPRAKFADGLQLVEKVGHSKRMQVLRREWIDEGKPDYLRSKPKKRMDGDGDFNETANEKETTGKNQSELGGEPRKPDETRKSLFGNGQDDEDLFFRDETHRDDDEEDEAPEDDELEALLAEQMRSKSIAVSKQAQPESEGEDDLDAILAEQDMRRAPVLVSSSKSKTDSSVRPEHQEVDEDDLDALLAESEAQRQRPTLSTARATKAVSTEMNEINEQDLDALVAEQESLKQFENPISSSKSAVSGKVISASNIPVEKEQEDSEQPATLSSSPISNDEFDDADFDALIGEEAFSAAQKQALKSPFSEQAPVEVMLPAQLSAETEEPAKEDSQLVFSSPMPNEYDDLELDEAAAE